MDEAQAVLERSSAAVADNRLTCGSTIDVPDREPTRAVRLWSALIFAPSAFLIGVARWLQPAPGGVGTHRQLGMPPCAVLHVTGVPCPMCGCTTAVSLVAHGQWLRAIWTQPFGAAVGLAALGGLALSVIGLATGRWYGPSWFRVGWWWALYRWQLVVIGLAFFLLAWVWKIYSHAHGL